MKLRPGAVVILEGPNKAGKTTQREGIRRLAWEEPIPLITHMASGVTELTRVIYGVTENQAIGSSLARQLLHLACHAENLPLLTAARRERGVLVDRWWWSTVAYGWFGGLDRAVDEAAFLGTIEMVWGDFPADVVFLFLSAFERDPHNVSSIAEGYRSLASRYPAMSVEVPVLSEAETTDFMLSELGRRGLLIR